MSDLRRVLYNACNPNVPATAEYYVDGSAVRGSNAFAGQVREELELSDESLRFLFTGHIGSGKSSELEHLRLSLEQSAADGKRFFPIFLDAGEYLNDYDVAPSDILLAIVAEVAEALKTKAGIELKDSYFVRRFDEIKRFFLRDVDVDEVEIPLWEVKPKIKLLKQAPTVREQVREHLRPRMPSILSEINSVFDEARLKLRQHAPADGARPYTDIVLILDNLEKIQHVASRKEGEDSHRYLFIECAPQLIGLNAHVIYTVPLRLVHSHGADLRAVYGVDPFVLPMIKVESRGTHAPYEPGRECLREILRKRSGGADLGRVFTPEALDCLLTYSGGHIRDLMGFVRQACSKVKALPIDLPTARRALDGSYNIFSVAIPAAYWPKLARLERSPNQLIDPNDPNFGRMLEMIAVMEYRNGDGAGSASPAVPWYAVNPIVRELPQFKAALAALDAEGTPP